MNETRSNTALHCGAVRLVVRDIERSLAYYQDRIGLRLHRRDGGVAWLGAGAADLL
ncbi:MAG TPA: glyoxalase, partial [Chloroflexi bacterium]|nr:glyoxalase [Chloroflexota bacterium]